MDAQQTRLLETSGLFCGKIKEKVGFAIYKGGALHGQCKSIRWKQRFENFEKSHVLLNANKDHPLETDDVDLAIVGDAVTHKTMVGLNDDLNEGYPLPYMFDLVHYDELSNEDLIKHIDQHGEELDRKYYDTYV